MTRLDPELKAHLDAMQPSLITRMVGLNNDTREHATHLHVLGRVLVEEVDQKVGLVWEGVQAITETLLMAVLLEREAVRKEAVEDGPEAAT